MPSRVFTLTPRGTLVSSEGRASASLGREEMEKKILDILFKNFVIKSTQFFNLQFLNIKYIRFFIDELILIILKNLNITNLKNLNIIILNILFLFI